MMNRLMFLSIVGLAISNFSWASSLDVSSIDREIRNIDTQQSSLKNKKDCKALKTKWALGSQKLSLIAEKKEIANKAGDLQIQNLIDESNSIIKELSNFMEQITLLDRMSFDLKGIYIGFGRDEEAFLERKKFYTVQIKDDLGHQLFCPGTIAYLEYSEFCFKDANGKNCSSLEKSFREAVPTLIGNCREIGRIEKLPSAYSREYSAAEYELDRIGAEIAVTDQVLKDNFADQRCELP